MQKVEDIAFVYEMKGVFFNTELFSEKKSFNRKKCCLQLEFLSSTQTYGGRKLIEISIGSDVVKNEYLITPL